MHTSLWHGKRNYLETSFITIMSKDGTRRLALLLLGLDSAGPIMVAENDGTRLGEMIPVAVA